MHCVAGGWFSQCEICVRFIFPDLGEIVLLHFPGLNLADPQYKQTVLPSLAVI